MCLTNKNESNVNSHTLIRCLWAICCYRYLFIIDCFDLVVFSVYCAVSWTVNQISTCDVMTCVSSWCERSRLTGRCVSGKDRTQDRFSGFGLCFKTRYDTYPASAKKTKRRPFFSFDNVCSVMHETVSNNVQSPFQIHVRFVPRSFSYLLLMITEESGGIKRCVGFFVCVCVFCFLFCFSFWR